MSTAQRIDGITETLLKMREEISQLPSELAFKGNAMSAINSSKDNLAWLKDALAKEEALQAEREAKNLEEARKVVATADAKATSVASTSKAANVVATPKAAAATA
jgi:hypothetical protein